MKNFKIKVKDVSSFVKEKNVLFASGDGKKFFIKLHAGPKVERYIVETKNGKRGFIKKGEAVRFFNEI